MGDRDIKNHLLLAENEVLGIRKSRVIRAFLNEMGLGFSWGTEEIEPLEHF